MCNMFMIWKVWQTWIMGLVVISENHIARWVLVVI